VKPRWRRVALRLVALGALLALAGFAVLLSGIIPIKASAGHWAITEWFLQLAKRRSLATHTLGIELPDLDRPSLIAKGAGHYETACRPCHGSPAQPRPRIAAAMQPPPPDLPPVIARRDPEELFYIVKHGIKFTGMPAWPTQHRDDEVHAMVAFLLALPALDAGAYRRLAYGDTAAPPSPESLRDLAVDAPPPATVIGSCARCHGVDGRARDSAAFPRLAGQRRGYLVRALAAYQRSHRHSGIMEPIAAGLTADEQRELAAYYSRLPAGPSRSASADASRIERGRAIALGGIASQEVPRCHDCHEPGPAPRNPAYPVLAGQFAEYLVLQLELFKRGQRGGSEYAHLMQRTAQQLTAEQMRDVAAYYEALAPDREAAR
jgi:cytochrome c553